MAVTRIDARTTNFVSELEKAIGAQVRFVNASKQLVREQTRVNSAGTLVIRTYKALGNQFDRTQVQITTLNKTLQSVATSQDVVANKADRAAASQAKFARQANALNAQLQRQAFGAGGQAGALSRGVTTAEVRAVTSAIAQLGELQTKHRVTSARILALWRDVEAGRGSAARGTNRQIFNQLVQLQQAQRRLGLEARNTAARIATAGLAATTSMKTATVATKTFILSWRDVIRITAISFGLRALFAFTNALKEGLDTAKEFSIAVGEIRTIDQAAVSTAIWTDNLRDLSDSFGIDILDEAEAAYQALSNQVVTGADATAFLAAANRLAITAVTDTSEAVNLLTAAINAFGLDASRADEISAKFFKTVELGRLRIQDISNIFGRVAVPASQLGISLEELNAGLAALTIQGVRAEEATTLIRNIVLKLIRPTSALKEAFAELGVESGAAAIQTFGFGGTLQRLIDQTGGNVEQLGELFGRIRAITGVLGFASDGLVTYNNALAAVNASTETFDERTKIITETSGFKLRRELTKIANVFKVDIGQTALNVISDLTGGFKLLVPIVRVFAEVVQVLVIGALVAFTAAVFRATLSVKAFTVALARNPFFLIVTLLTIAIEALLLFASAFGRAASRAQEAGRIAVKAINDQVAAERKGFQDRLTASRQFFRERIRLTLQATATTLSVLKSQSDGVIKSFEDTQKGVVEQIKILADFAGKRLAESESQVKRLQKSVTSISEDLADTFEGADEVVFNLRLGATDDPARQIALITERLQLLRGIAREDVKLFDTEGFEEAAKQINALNAQRAKILLTTEDEGQKQQIINAFTQAQNRLLAEQFNLRKKLLDQKQKELDDAKKLRDERAKDKKALDEAFKSFRDFNIENVAQLGNAKQVTAEFNKQRDNINTILGANERLGASVLDQATLARTLGALQKENEREVAAIRLKNARTTLNAILTRTDAEVDGALSAQRADEERITTLRRLIAQIAPLVSLDQFESGTFQAEIQNAFSLLQSEAKDGFSNLNRVEDAVDRINKQFIRLRGVTGSFDVPFGVGGTGVVTAGQKGSERRQEEAAVEAGVGSLGFNLSRESLSDLNKLLGRFRTLFDPDPAEAVFVNLDTQQKNIIDILSQTGRQQTEINRVLARQQQGIDEFTKQTGEVVDNTVIFNFRIDRANSALDDFDKQIRNLSGIISDINKRFPAEGNGTVTPSQGGFVYRQMGGFVPKGTDTIPAMLTPGEFVVNRDAARRFAGTLTAINSNLSPQRMQNGGSVSNNNVTINVSVDGAQSPDQMATEIGEALRRQIDRGTLPPLN